MANALIHAQFSVKRCGGRVEDYLPIHEFLDHTKILCSDNRHRILHTLWGIHEVVIPIWGAVIENSAGKKVDVKDICEIDHILVDFQNRFIPTLSDFTNAISPQLTDIQLFENTFSRYKNQDKVVEKLLSPLAYTGKIESLWFTHNSWFLNKILPKMGLKSPEIRLFEMLPADLFSRMSFQLWMDNGHFLPPSAVKHENTILSS